MAEIREVTRLEKESKKRQFFLEMWRGGNLRRSLLTIGAICIHSAQGSSYLTIYTTYYLGIAGVQDPFGYSILVTAMGILGVVSSMFVVRHMGRRTILLFGAAICGLTQLAAAIGWVTNPGTLAIGKLLVAMICLFTFGYTATAPYAWLVGSELPSLVLRSATYGVASSCNFVLNFLGTYSAPFFINPAANPGWGATYGFIWFGSNLIVAIFVWFCLPETKDRTLEEIDELFEAKVSPRKWKHYETVKTKAIASRAVGEKQEVEVVEHAADQPAV